MTSQPLPDGGVSAPLPRDQVVRVWPAHTAPVRALTTMWADGRSYVVSGGDDGRVVICDEYGRAAIGERPHRGPVTCFATHGSSGVLLSGGADGEIHAIHFPSGTPAGSLADHDRPLVAVQTLAGPNGLPTLVGVDDRGELTVSEDITLDADVKRESGQRVSTQVGRVHDAVIAAYFIVGEPAPTGGPLVAMATDDGVVVWDLDLGRVRERHRDGVPWAAVATSGPWLMGASAVGDLAVWGLEDGEERFSALRTAENGRVLDLSAFEIHAEIILVVTYEHGTVAVHRVDADGRLGDVLTSYDHREGARATTWLTTGPEPPRLVTGGADGLIHIWPPSPATRPDLTLRLHGRAVHAAVTLPDGRLVTAGGDGRLRAWDAGTGDLVAEPPRRHQAPVHALALATGQDVATSGERPLLASAGGDQHLCFWDATTLQPVGDPHPLSVGPVRALCTLPRPDGQPAVAVGGDNGRVEFWAADPPVRLDAQTPEFDRAVTALVAIPGAGLIAAGDREGRIQVWDPWAPALDARELDAATEFHDADGFTTSEGRAHRTAVTALTVAPSPASVHSDDHRLLVSGSEGGELRVWDPAAGRCVLTLYDAARIIHGGTPESAYTYDGAFRSLHALHAGSRRLLACGRDGGGVQVWDLDDPDQPVRERAGFPGGAWTITDTAPRHTDDVVPGAALVVGDARGGLAFWPLASDGLPVPVSDPAEERGVLDRVVPAPAAGDETLLTLTTKTEADVTPPPADEARGATDAHPLTDDDDPEDLLGREILAKHLDAVLHSLAQREPGGASVVHVDGRWGSGKTTLVDLMLNPTKHNIPEDPAAPRALTEPVVVRYDAWRESAVAPEWWSMATAIHRAVRQERARSTQLAMTLSDYGYRVVRSPAALITVTFLLAMATGLILDWWPDVGAVATTVTAIVTVAALAIAGGRALFWTSPAFGRLHVRADDNPLAEIAGAVARLRRWSPRNGSDQRFADNALGAWILLDVLGTTALVLAHPVPLTDPTERLGLALGQWATVATGLVALMPAVAVHALWSGRLRTERRPIVLVIDDLDRCEAARVVKLLETVHTLLREACGPTRFTTWRAPTALLIVALADGRWVRQSFEAHYADYASLGSNVHGLGADFLQKVFSHTVFVPSLSAAQREDYLARVLAAPKQPARTDPGPPSSTPTASGSPPPPSIGSESSPDTGETAASSEAGSGTPTPAELSPEAQQVEDRITGAAPGDLYSPELDQALGGLDNDEERDRLAGVRAHAAVQPAELAYRRRHLLENFTTVMPANPRLVKRAVNAFSMLMALRDHVRHTESADVVTVAAIASVRFPALVDQLLSEADPPDPADPASPWHRRDVHELLHALGKEGRPVEPEQLAGCFGRSYPTPVPEPADRVAVLP